MSESKIQCWLFKGVEALTEEAAELLFDVVELYEFTNPDDFPDFPELNVIVTENEVMC